MLNHFSKNVFKQILGIARYNYKAFLWFILIGSTAFFLNKIFAIPNSWLPVLPVTVLGGAIAIFIAFKNNSAYDRWWEARKIWGALVNSSRMFATEVLTLMTMKHAVEPNSESILKTLQKTMIHRHIAFVHALRMSLRKNVEWETLKPFLSETEFEEMMRAPNKCTYLNHRQGKDLEFALSKGFIEDFRHMALLELIKDFYDQQGMSERIKKTIFPFYYTYFTKVFLWLFIIILPFSLIENMNIMSVPLSVAISFVFYILDKLGNATEDPFENRAADIPMTAISNTIEIDLRYLMGEKDYPEATKPNYTRYKVEYIN